MKEPEPDAALSQLIDQAQRGDPQAVEQLFTRYLPDLESFLRFHGDARTLSRESRADVAMSVCREVLAGLRGFEYRGPSSFRNWLFQAARNKVIDKHRYHAADCRDGAREVAADAVGPPPDPPGEQPSPSQAAIAREDADRLLRALEALPQEQREIVLLAHFQGLSHGEIAARLGTTVEASRTLLRRALIRLSGELVARPEEPSQDRDPQTR